MIRSVLISAFNDFRPLTSGENIGAYLIVFFAILIYGFAFTIAGLRKILKKLEER